MKKMFGMISSYQFPLFLMGLLAMSITAQGVIVFFATRPDAPRPLADYYQKSLQWDHDRAVESASESLGWRTRFEVPAGPEVVAGMPRPVDVVVEDKSGAPVTGLSADVYALRPADGRLNAKGHLVELPHAPGHYRALLALEARGLWELGIDAKKETARYVHRERVMVEPGER